MTSQMSFGFDWDTSVREHIRKLPKLPSHIRYVDEYDEDWRTIESPYQSDVWQLNFDTTRVNINFSKFEDLDVRYLLKHFMFWLLGRNATGYAARCFGALLTIKQSQSETWFLKAIDMPIEEWKLHWDGSWCDSPAEINVHTIKLLLNFFCELSIGHFCTDKQDFIRFLPVRYAKGSRGVQSGEVILTLTEETAIVCYLDEMARKSNNLDDAELLKASLLCISYQHGLRPVQICRLNLAEFTIFEGVDGIKTAHFQAHRAKKRTPEARFGFKRRVKREWSPILVEYLTRRQHSKVWKHSERAKDTKFFPVERSKITTLIGDTTEAITGVRRTAIPLRHTAAQRLVDSGANAEEVAEFLGHSHTKTSLCYFEASPTQAEKLNQALAVSPIYSAISEVAKTKTIDKQKLLRMPADQQVGGVPHGIPISGIGACGIGQSMCAKHPALSCYTCPKFLPVSERSVHSTVFDNLRQVVRFFFDASQGDNQSPAFVQLKTTLEAIKQIIVDIPSEEVGSEHE
ncbi:tyrosine-type recombinase/integrase [Thalassospira lucentensis]|uniref:tyrosine-type recombinase/integrase n=1 Tax=Thalassospira lucentensis TaxID=168935 RepID=UPI0003B6BDD9|nr:tyrosine-type recombinase/integrase [Thalassospira lucentensis]RCK26411.1 hypothetical protein TH1_13150 [Thalassospira lucentensis MCCC 1A00383 = DSM 14000]